MKTLWKVGIAGVALTVVSLSLIGPAKADGKDNAKDVTAGTLTTLWTAPKEAGPIVLLLQGKPNPVTVAVSDTTIMGGTCRDCRMLQKFKAGDAAKHCQMCGCDAPNVECVAWASLKHNTWDALLRALPLGVGLRAVYNETDKPESGLKSLLIDRHAVLLPIDGLSGQTEEQLQTLVKPFGGSKAQLINDGKQLLFTVKDEWTVETEAKFEKALAKADTKLTYPAAEETKK